MNAHPRRVLWPDEIPFWLRARRLPTRTLLGPTAALLDYARENGHEPPTLLELDEARRRRREVLAEIRNRKEAQR